VGKGLSKIRARGEKYYDEINLTEKIVRIILFNAM
jgi:hypothetical protein